MTDRALARVIVVLLFALTFTFMGWSAPVLYSTYAPGDMIVETHAFTAEDTTTQAGEHFICWDRSVYSPSSGQIFTELYLVSEDNTRTQVSASTIDRYFQQGRQEIIQPMDLPEATPTGTYRYLLVVQMDLADGRVTRDFAFTSDPFNITPGTDEDVEFGEMHC